MDASFRGLRQVFQSRNLPRSLQTEAAVPRKECQSLLLFLPKSLEAEGREGAEGNHNIFLVSFPTRPPSGCG